jgi:stage III sporulation protein SpoIIIAA/flagellar hook-basal body complex protein FliE
MEPLLDTENELQLLLDVLPKRIQTALQHFDLDELMEVVLDVGRFPEGRFSGKKFDILDTEPVSYEELESVLANIGDFTSDNRAGITRTLHRISAIRNRKGQCVGLTCRIGKAVTGTIDCIQDLVQSGKSMLILGPPGVGKTTKLREIAKLLADEQQKRVIIVDTSNEIAGDGDIPHPAVGRARRMQVSSPEKQQQVMIEAVENHTPEVIIVDEIGTEEEALASRTIAERGVILIATAHGATLENLIKNPMLSDLVGGVQSVTLGDDEAKRRSTQKTVLEREKRPTFDVAVELRDRYSMAIYPDVAEAVDHLLRGWTLFPEVRKVDLETGTTKVLQTKVKVLHGPIETQTIKTQPRNPEKTDFGASFNPILNPGVGKPVSLRGEAVERFLTSAAASEAPASLFRVFLYGITNSFVERILERLELSRSISITRNLHDADAVLALRSQARQSSKVLRMAQDYEVPIYYAKTNTLPQIQKTLREAIESFQSQKAAFSESFEETILSKFSWANNPSNQANNRLDDTDAADENNQALKEVMDAIEKVKTENVAVELSPRRSYIRRLQHELVEKHTIISFSVGDEPNRRLKLLPPSSDVQATQADWESEDEYTN